MNHSSLKKVTCLECLLPLTIFADFNCTRTENRLAHHLYLVRLKVARFVTAFCFLLCKFINVRSQFISLINHNYYRSNLLSQVDFQVEKINWNLKDKCKCSKIKLNFMKSRLKTSSLRFSFWKNWLCQNKNDL